MRFIYTICFLLIAHLGVAQCNPSFTWQPEASGNNLLQVLFVNNTSYTSSPNFNASFTIDFGDGNAMPLTDSLYYNYAAPGLYAATLHMTAYDTVNGVIACADSSFDLIAVEYSPCATSVSLEFTSTGQIIASAQTPAGTPNMIYVWSGLAGFMMTGQSIIVPDSNCLGVFTLMATGGGCTYENHLHCSLFDLYSGYAALHDSANFSAMINGNDVQFVNTSTPAIGREIKTYWWDFGDSTTSTLENPLHTYADSGYYLVTLVTEWRDSINNDLYLSDTVSYLLRTGDTTTLSVSQVNNPEFIFRAGFDGNTLVLRGDMVPGQAYETELTNLPGQKIMISRFTAESNAKRLVFDRSLPSGIYILRLSSIGQKPQTTVIKLLK